MQSNILLRFSILTFLLLRISDDFVALAREQPTEIKITLTLEKVPFKKALQEIEKKSGLNFIYNSKDLDNESPVTVKYENASIEYILEDFLCCSGFYYKKTKNNVVIKKIPSQVVLISDSEKNYKSIQQFVVTGKVSNEQGEAIVGVNVKVTEDGKSTVTDNYGHYSIALNSKSAVLEFTYLGYKREEISVESRKTINITLYPQNSELSEVVITGVAQGTSRKSLSFALTKLNEEQINAVPGLDASQSLRGKVAGVSINQSSGNSAPTVYLRGAKSVSGYVEPLLVVDGLITGLSLSDISPQNIESIEVVKGAAASALYGTRGEGGVIHIITKNGKSLEKTKIQIDNEFGFSRVQRTPLTTQYHHFQVNDDGSFVLDGNLRKVDYAENGYSVNLHPYQAYYDNVHEVLSQNTFYNNYISLASSTQKLNLFASFQNQHKGGIAKVGKSDGRQGGQLNLGYKLNKKIELNFLGQYTVSNTPSSMITSYDGSFLYTSLLSEPFINLQERSAEGNYVYNPAGFEIQDYNDINNPFYVLSNREYTDKNENLLLGGNIKYRIFENLTAELNGSIGRKTNNIDDYYPIGYQTVKPDITVNNGYYGLTTGTSLVKNGQFQLNYNRKFNKLESATVLKAVYEEYKEDGFSASGYNLSAPVKNLAAASSDTRDISSSWSKTVNQGYFLNQKIEWNEKIFIDLLARIDRSSRFGSDASTAVFPRASIAYRLTEDVPLGIVSDLKLRAAYGQAGSLPLFGAKNSQVTITSTGGVSYTQNANTNLKRAVTEELEIGIDAVLFNKVSMHANYANATSKNDFIEVPSFTPTDGSTSIYSNLGKVKSKAFEIEASGLLINRKFFKWSAGLTFSKVKSSISSLGGVPEFTDDKFRKSVGHSPYEFYGKKVFTNLSQLQTDVSGFVTNAGDGSTKLDDYVVNSLGIVVLKSTLGTANESAVFYTNSATGDMTYLGNAEPDFTAGLSNSISIGRFSIYSLFDWQHGGLKHNNTQQRLIWQYRSLLTEKAARAGLPLNFVDLLYDAGRLNSYFLDKTSYLALRELSVNYDLPINKISFLKPIGGVKVSVVGRNIYTWTNFTGITPEGTTDSFDYPNYATISGRIIVEF